MKFALALSALVSISAHADLLTLKPGTVSKNGVNISVGATGSIDDGKTSFELVTVGSGLRNKQVVFNIPVYVAQILVNDEKRFVKSDGGALPSLDNEKQVAIRLTFLRDVDAPTVATSFQEALDANKVSAKDTDINNFMTLVNKGADAKNGTSLTILMVKNDDGSETLVYENGAVKSQPMRGAKDLTHKIMSIWLGNVSEDNGLKALKAELLK